MKIKNISLLMAGLLVWYISGCERSVDGLGTPEYSTNPAVFIDGFSAGLNYAAFGGSVPTAFDVDKKVTYNNSVASMRIEVPDANDSRGAYAGGVYFTSSPRNLSEYDALTFWVKATQPATVGVFGLGNDLGESRFNVSLTNVLINTNWKKIIIPLPNPSKLNRERGMFYYSTGPENGRGYTFWIDEVKFEKLGTIAHPQLAIYNGNDKVESSYSGITTQIAGLVTVFNMPDGANMPVNVSSSYFDFTSTDTTVAKVDSQGRVTVGTQGSAVVTASLSGVAARGSLTVNSQGAYLNAPTPTHLEADVISLFSDAYTNVPVSYYNGYWAPYQTTLSADFEVLGDHVLNYTNFNFVGIEFSSPTINASQMTHFHINLFFPNDFVGSPSFQIELVDFGADGVFGGSDNTSHRLTFRVPIIKTREWITLDIPLASFTGLRNRAHLGQIIFEGPNGNVPGFFADNIYFHK